MMEGYEKEILIQLSALEGTYTIYCAWGFVPSAKNYTWKSEMNMILISPTHHSYHREGVYFVTIIPITSIAQQLEDLLNWSISKNATNIYKYQLTYSSEDQFTYIKAKGEPINGKQSRNSLKYYRHFFS